MTEKELTGLLGIVLAMVRSETAHPYDRRAAHVAFRQEYRKFVAAHCVDASSNTSTEED